MEILKTAIVGAGFIGKQHIEAVRRIPGVKVVALADSDKTTAENTAQRLDVPAFYTNYEEMLEKEKPDIVHNCTPTGMHYPINRSILEKGIHLYCEKPFTLTSEQSEELCILAREKRVAAGVNFNYRGNVMVHEMRERIREGYAGEILSVYGEYLQDWMLYKTDYDWRMDPALGGESRAVADIGSHLFDMLQFVLGERIVAVYAKLLTVHPVRIKPDNRKTFSSGNGRTGTEVPIHSEDIAFIMLRFENGCSGLLNLNQVCAGKKNGMTITISGSKNAMEWHQERPDHLWVGHRECGNEDIYASVQYLCSGAKPYATLPNGHPVGWADAFRNGIMDFYIAVRQGVARQEGQAYATIEDGCYIMRLVEACLQSSREGRWIELAETNR